MEEQIIIKSEKYDFRKITLIWFAITALIVLILHLSMYLPYYDFWFDLHNDAHIGHHNLWCYGDTAYECASASASHWLWFTLFIPIVSSLFFFGVFFLLTYFTHIVVTNKRVYGKTYFGHRIDMPMDSVSSVGSAWLKGISVSTSSGRISFLLIKNAREIHEEIRKLLIIRQEKDEREHLRSSISPQSNAEELKKYKELFDSGFITQEEFEAKKKQLLGL